MSQRARDWLIGLATGAIGMLVAMALIAIVSAQSQSAPADVCMDAETREKVRVILLDALDSGLKDRTMHVYEVWMKDNYDQPRRAGVGARQAVIAYVDARTFILKQWNPPPCPT